MGFASVTRRLSLVTFLDTPVRLCLVRFLHAITALVPGLWTPPRVGESRLKPTVRQIYALARALCTQTDTRWPDTRAEASELIERLRREDPLGNR